MNDLTLFSDLPFLNLLYLAQVVTPAFTALSSLSLLLSLLFRGRTSQVRNNRCPTAGDFPPQALSSRGRFPATSVLQPRAISRHKRNDAR